MPLTEQMIDFILCFLIYFLVSIFWLIYVFLSALFSMKKINIFVNISTQKNDQIMETLVIFVQIIIIFFSNKCTIYVICIDLSQESWHKEPTNDIS